MKKKTIATVLVMGVLAFSMMGCQNEETSVVSNNEDVEIEEDETQEGIDYEAYITSIEEQSDSIKSSLENDPLTQMEMNEKSQELYELWDGALNYLWGELKKTLLEEEFEKLRDEQRIWIADKEKAVEEAGKEFEGGSLYPTIVNGEAASITEKRVYELYELLK